MSRLSTHRTHQLLIVCLVAGLFCLLPLTPADARPNIRDAFFGAYPNAVGTPLDTVPSFPTHCGVCHYDFSGGGTRNPYGLTVENALPSFPSNPNGRRSAVLSVENQDADGDGFTALIEVTDTTNFGNTPTFPGLTPANFGNVSNVTLSDIQAYLVPSTGGDVAPPAVTVMSPNGGEFLVGNAAALVEWTATDPSGVAAVDIELSDDGGLTFRPVALGLPNTGSHTWYVPNRPTVNGLIRVVAIDNAFNSGSDVSDSPFFIESPPGGIVPSTLRDFDLPGSQPFEAGTLNPPSACAPCHANYDPSVEPYFNWSGSMMSQASRDLLFEACMTVANQDAPDSGDLCLRCHLPRGWLRGRSVPTDGSQMLSTDMTGVACDLCHRLVDPFYVPGTSPPVDQDIINSLVNPPVNFGNGMFIVDPNGARRGPFANADTGHAVLISPFHREAALCGTCHDVSNPAFERDGSGNFVPNPMDAPATSFSAHTLMPIERTYSEWFYSDYNTVAGVVAPQFSGNKDFVGACQDCHMRDVTGKGCNLAEAPERTDLPLHDMTGGSTWLPSLLPSLYPGEVDPTAIQAGIDRARYMLQNAASLAAEQNGTTLDITVTNETGHKLPTGYPEGRRMWLNVKFYDDAMNLLGESGVWDSATGILLADSALKVYETKPGLDGTTAPLVGVDPGPSFHFVLNNKIFKDNRIPPRGFTNSNYAQFGGSPVGHAYADGQYWDVTTYTVPAGATSAQITLYYQSTSKEYVQFLRDENVTDTKGQELFDLWNNNSKCPPEIMRSATLVVTPPADVCDDGVCGPTEDSCDCPQDCGPPSAGEEPGVACADGADNDCDGNADCDDPDCVGEPGCPECFVDADCDDGQRCNGLETCDPVDGVCVAGTPPSCDDGFACTTDSCDPAANGGAGACVNTPNDADCDNGQYCDGAETCAPSVPGAGPDGCVAGTPPSCDDGFACTTDSCDPAANGGAGACVNTPNDAYCDNGQFCDGAEMCVPSNPAADPSGCMAGFDPCPNTNCDEINDVCTDCLLDEDCHDGQLCNGLETCDTVNGTCVPGTPPSCDDGFGCTTDSCDPFANGGGGACLNTPSDSFCDNGQFCDGAESCVPTNPSAGPDGCVGGTDPTCGDGFACTTDSCDPQANGGAGACLNAPNDAFCDNGQFCDGVETCAPTDPAAGPDGCVAGTPPSCDDGNVCTADFCDPVLGCQHDGTGITVPCDDHNAGTINDFCQADAAGTCRGTPVVATPAPAPYPHNRPKNRYISFAPNNAASPVAFKVELKSLELGSCSGNGAPCRVDRGDADCNACSVAGNPCISTVDCSPMDQACAPTGETCVNDWSGSVGLSWWVGPESPRDNAVHLLVSEPFRLVRADWPAVVHVGDCEVVPQAAYGVQAVEVGSGAASGELLVSTIARPGGRYWADGVGNLGESCTCTWTPCPNGAIDCPAGESCIRQWAPPDGVTNFDDVTATVFLFQSTSGLIVPHVSWVDMHGNDSGTPGSEMFDPPNYAANFSDLQFIILAFQGRPYPFFDPADCPDAGTWP